MNISARYLASVVETEGSNVWVDHAEVEWGIDLVVVGEGDEDGAIDGWVAFEGLGICLCQYLSSRYRRSPVVLDRVFEIHTWLANVGSHGRAVTHGDVGKWSVGDVQLRDEASELWLTGQGASDVRVVWSHLLSWSLPLEENITSWIREWNRAVVRDGGITVVSLLLMVVASISLGGLTSWSSWSESNSLVESSSVGVPSVDVWLVEDSQLWEVLPCETLAVRWARADVRREISPSPRLWNTGLEPDWHWKQASHLSE